MAQNGEVSDEMQTEETVEGKRSHDQHEVEESQRNGSKEIVRSPAKRGRRKATGPGSSGTPQTRVSKEASTPLIDRPAREKRSIERFADSVEKEKEKPKEFKIDQGSGSFLRDIPNVVFKLSKRKTSDELVQLLHRILYSKRVKPYHVKTNILQFSGFVWGSNEEKDKTRVKEKLEKIVKENLFQLSDLLDLSISRTTKKEDVVSKMFEFLECPHKTTEELVQDQTQKQKEKKREKNSIKKKRKRSSSQLPQKRPRKEQIGEEQEEYDMKQEDEAMEIEESEEIPVKKKATKSKKPARDTKSNSGKKAGRKSIRSNAKDETEDVVEAEETEPEHEEDDKKLTQKQSRKKKTEDGATSKSPKKGSRKPVKTKSIYEPGEDDLLDDVKDVKSKRLSKVSKKGASKETKTSASDLSKERKKSTPTSTKAPSRKKKEINEIALESKSKKKTELSQSGSKELIAPPIPPDEDLRSAICELLRDADFSTVTFTDVVKQLGARFNVDLSERKAHVKNLIQEEISKIVDEDDGDGDNEETGVSTPDRKEKEPVEAATDV